MKNETKPLTFADLANRLETSCRPEMVWMVLGVFGGFLMSGKEPGLTKALCDVISFVVVGCAFARCAFKLGKDPIGVFISPSPTQNEGVSSQEDLQDTITELKNDNARRAELLRELLAHAEHLEAQLNPTGAEIPEPELYDLVREWAHPEDCVNPENKKPLA